MKAPSSEVIGQVKNITTPIKFFIYQMFVFGIILVALVSTSKLDPSLTEKLVVILFCYIILLSVFSIGVIAMNPKRYLYSKEEWIKIETEQQQSKVKNPATQETMSRPVPKTTNNNPETP